MLPCCGIDDSVVRIQSRGVETIGISLRGRYQPVVQKKNNMKHACVFWRPNPSILGRIPNSFSGKFGRRANTQQSQSMSTILDEQELEEFKDFIDSLKNYEKSGVPKDAATDSKDGFDLGRMRRLMQLLGNPQREFKTIHIAGTKGKGSTAAFLSSILRAEGYSVGCYTSPHIRTIRERITLGVHGHPVSSKLLGSHFQSLRTVLDHAVERENRCLSHFEVLTAVAFSLFAKENVDFAVIEAGLGGARDATNVVSSPSVAASIITTIGEEHMAALGGSLESIAQAKSGIIKERSPVVLGGPFLPYIEQIFRDKASSMCSPVLLASDTGNKSKFKNIGTISDTPYQCCDIVLNIEKDIPLFVELLNVKLSMLGPHQLQNATTATCAALCLRNQGETATLLNGKNTTLNLRDTTLSARFDLYRVKNRHSISAKPNVDHTIKLFEDQMSIYCPENRFIAMHLANGYE